MQQAGNAVDSDRADHACAVASWKFSSVSLRFEFAISLSRPYTGLVSNKALEKNNMLGLILHSIDIATVIKRDHDVGSDAQSTVGEELGYDDTLI